MFVTLCFSNPSSTHSFNWGESQTCRIFRQYVVQVKTRLGRKTLCQYRKKIKSDQKIIWTNKMKKIQGSIILSNRYVGIRNFRKSHVACNYKEWRKLQEEWPSSPEVIQIILMATSCCQYWP